MRDGTGGFGFIEPDEETVQALLRDAGPASVTAAVDADSGGVGEADLVFVFGTTFTDPIAPVVELIEHGLAPAVVVTGGSNRMRPDHREGDVHARLLRERGVDDGGIIVENESRTTLENVTLARPLIEARLGEVRCVIAVVKWFHRRAVLTLLNHMPSVERVHTVTYDPGADAGQPLTRTNWAGDPRARHVVKEHAYLTMLDDTKNALPIRRDGTAWIRGEPSSSPVRRVQRK